MQRPMAIYYAGLLANRNNGCSDRVAAPSKLRSSVKEGAIVNELASSRRFFSSILIRFEQTEILESLLSTELGKNDYDLF
jgi:hypothetical protein